MSVKQSLKENHQVVICAGGTGGHIFPAQALAAQLMKANQEINVCFVGGGLAANPYFDRDRFSFHEVCCGGFSLRQPLRCLISCGKIFKGMINSRRILQNIRPNLVVGFGSYYTVPPLLAAKMSGYPIILHAADSVPGKVIRLLSRYVETTGIQFPEAAKFLKGKSQEVKLPLREGFYLSQNGKVAAQEYFQLNPKLLTVLIFGGSQGAKGINHLVAQAIVTYLPDFRESIQIIHCVGNSENVENLSRIYSNGNFSARVKPFEERMDLAWSCADLVISRSGASSIAEQIEFEVPGILIPYPHAADDHQMKNAEFMTKRIGGALMFLQSLLQPSTLAFAIRKLLHEEQALLKGMKQAIHIYKHRPHQKDLCSLVLEKLNQRNL